MTQKTRARAARLTSHVVVIDGAGEVPIAMA
jgi:hypothetical protein